MVRRVILSGPDFCAVTEDGVLVEYVQKGSESRTGNILLGTVARLMPGIGGAFVEIGRAKCGFLPLKENSISFSGSPLRSGDKIAVQIRKEEIRNREKEGKGAFLTRDLVIPGKMVLLMPMNRYIAVSARITGKEERERLKNIGQRIAENAFGLVMRSAALEAGTEEIEEEAVRLTAEWKNIQEQIRQGGKNGTVLYQADPETQIIEDYAGRGGADQLKAKSLNADLHRQLSESRSRKIRLKNGGNIVIDRCEAMTVIDVNSGSASGDGQNEAAYLETNLAACAAIAAQIRLRNLSGIILIDFIDMNREEDRIRTSAKLQKCLEQDRRKTVIHGWTKLGILEMTRKRTD